MRVGSFEPHGEPECAKFSRLVSNGYNHYLSNVTHFDSEEDEWFSVKAANPVFFVRSYGIDRNDSITMIRFHRHQP
ncbi:hypothetical protein X777_05436 [Ooceraea biroi]|uniref:Uncharacterized protein n=1 Tax=Ooceraea biroi TaxID=2015173 RepID=A0A026X425_OOCBI|nr:hypothetical protein X777_05436 [Ooceraea biroi]